MKRSGEGSKATRRLALAAADSAVRFVFPTGCLVCTQQLAWPTPDLCICDSCRATLRPPAHLCPLCGSQLPPRDDAWLCVACARRPPAFDGLAAAWTYEPPAAQVVRGLKFQGLRFLAAEMAVTMADRCRDLRQLSGYVVTEVPLHWRRRLRRGYDQAGRLACALAAELDVPHRPLLRRTRPTPAQTSLGRVERLRNLDHAFRPRRGRRPPRSVVLVDDVATTGATLDAAAEALKSAGVKRVFGVVAALTPKRREGFEAQPENHGSCGSISEMSTSHNAV